MTRSDKARKRRARENAAQTSNQSPLRNLNLLPLMPHAGMTYQSPARITSRASIDRIITRSLRVHFGEDVGRPEVDQTMAEIFVAAEKAARDRSPRKDPAGPLAFLQKVWQPLLQSSDTSWVRKMRFKGFVKFFLIVRAARLRWIKSHRGSGTNDQVRVSELARAIDTFEVAAKDKVEWVGVETVHWLRKELKNLDKDVVGGDEPAVPGEVDDDVMDGENEDGSKIVGEASGGDDADILQAICQQLQDFSLDVDGDALAKMVGKLSI